MQTLDIPDFYKILDLCDDPGIESAIMLELLRHGADATHADKRVSFVSTRQHRTMSW